MNNKFISPHTLPIEADQVVPYAIEMESSIRRKLGRDFNIKEVFTEEKIRESQALIDTAHRDFLEDVQKDLAAIEKFYALAASSPAKAKPAMGEIAQKAFVIKGRLESLGLQMACTVARLLNEYTNGLREMDDKKLLVIRKHIDVLANSIKEQTKDDGGPVGQQLLEVLRALGQKFA